MRVLDALAWFDGRAFLVLLAVAAFLICCWIVSSPSGDDDA